MNIIIAGDGEMGSHLAKLLSKEDHDITLINPNPDFLEEISNEADILTMEGDAVHISVLQMAGISKCDLFISVMHIENPNIVACIMAKKLGAKHCIARVSAIENLEPENKKIFKELGIDNLVSPERIAAKEIVRLIKQTAADEIFDFSEGKLSLFSIKLDERALVINKSLQEIDRERGEMGFRAVAVIRDGQTIIPNGNTRFHLGDLAYIITKPEGVEQIMKMGGRTKQKMNNVMLVGGGRIGSNVALNLEDKVNLKLIEIDRDRCFLLSDILHNTLIINGDVRDLSLLEDENISSMDAFISVTRDSETNILTCLLAKKYGVKKTIALIENMDFIDVAHNVGIDTIINKKLIASSYIERFAFGKGIESFKMLSGVEAEVLELIVAEGSYITSKKIADLELPENAIIGGLIRNNVAVITRGSTKIEAGDKVIVFSLPSCVRNVNKLFN
ncbi:MAG: Trk system potassium transporter TrkA [Bacteroidales bacterium]|nr:Trk system potassium transporter TrkA [Bacteroidales bacterium]